MLLQEVFDIADAQSPPRPIVLEATKAGLPFYEHVGFDPVQEQPRILVRRGPRNSAA